MILLAINQHYTLQQQADKTNKQGPWQFNPSCRKWLILTKFILVDKPKTSKNSDVFNSHALEMKEYRRKAEPNLSQSLLINKVSFGLKIPETAFLSILAPFSARLLVSAENC